MKRLFILFALAALVSCSDIDDRPIVVTKQLQEALQSKHPNATNIRWDMKQNYYVADFNDLVIYASLVECEAWFGKQGKWHMTEIDIPYSSLPEAVRAAFEASEYADWRIDDIDKVERDGMETIYVIEVEQRDNEVDLYYTEDGTLVKSNPDGKNDESYLPEAPEGGVDAYIATHYPNAKILDYDRDDGLIEVDILDGQTVRELYFDRNENWLRTKTDIAPNALPQAVMDAIAANGYQGWRIDEAEHILEANREFFELELESGERDIDLRITPTGEIIK